jgi:hypothetical protein
VDRLEYSEEELLSSIAYDEPLIANGVRCHGGFVGARYHSPRSAGRGPAIAAWQGQLRARGVPLIEIPTALVPPHYPNPAQAALLLREGVRAPLVRTLTTIAIIEGFGAMIRDQRVPDLSRCIREPLAGTASAHLTGGLFEAHARDEAGHRSEGGHKQMWEAARDLALDNPPVPPDVLMRLMGGRRSGGGRQRLFPRLAAAFEELLAVMVNVLVIEVFAADTFGWAETVLGDPEVSSAPREAAAMVGYIRSDETPHVEYLRTALTEMRDRTFVCESGRRIAGTEVIGVLWAAALEQSLGVNRENFVRTTTAEVEHALASHPRRAEVLEGFHALGSS